MAPLAWLLIGTLTAGWQKLFDPDPAIGFLSHASKFADAAAAGRILTPASSLEEMRRVVGNDTIDAGLCLMFMVVVVTMVAFAIPVGLRALASGIPTARETEETGERASIC